MQTETLTEKSQSYLTKLCEEIPERCVGSEGNRRATQFFEEETAFLGWKTQRQEFEALDWKEEGAHLEVGGESFEVFVSPYSLSCQAEATLVSASKVEELQQLAMKDKVVLLQGELAKEQLMPKNFVFYNPEEHQQIISLLEQGKPKALICATGRNSALAGGVYPFPLIEDGDFNIPSVYMTEEEGQRLLAYAGKTVTLRSKAQRLPGKGYNVIARRGKQSGRRIVITAHIDAKKGTPGAIDNATGVIVLLLLAKLLENYEGARLLELVALNGEDHYAIPGQMFFVKANQGHFQEILLNINIDGLGYKEGGSAFSLYNLPQEMEHKVKEVLGTFPGIAECPQWPQGDHSIFVQQGCPALAVTSEWFITNMESQAVTHTPKDNPAIVDCEKVVEIAQALQKLLCAL